jgi:hypothetical protein
VCINEDKKKKREAAAAAAGPLTLQRKAHTVGEFANTPRRSFRVAAAPAAAATSPAALELTATIASHGWQHIPLGNRSLQLLQKGWTALLATGEISGWDRKRGGFLQTDARTDLTCSLEDQHRVALLSKTEAAFRNVLRFCGVDDSKLRLGDVKLLRTEFGQGQQEIHCDSQDEHTACMSYTVLIYLSDTISTAVSIQPTSEARHFACFCENAVTVREELLTRDDLHSFPVKTGDVLTLRNDSPHAGPANPNKPTRDVLFCHFSPKSLPPVDTENQRYPQGVDD